MIKESHLLLWAGVSPQPELLGQESLCKERAQPCVQNLERSLPLFFSFHASLGFSCPFLHQARVSCDKPQLSGPGEGTACPSHPHCSVVLGPQEREPHLLPVQVPWSHTARLSLSKPGMEDGDAETLICTLLFFPYWPLSSEDLL